MVRGGHRVRSRAMLGEDRGDLKLFLRLHASGCPGLCPQSDPNSGLTGLPALGRPSTPLRRQSRSVAISGRGHTSPHKPVFRILEHSFLVALCQAEIGPRGDRDRMSRDRYVGDLIRILSGNEAAAEMAVLISAPVNFRFPRKLLDLAALLMDRGIGQRRGCLSGPSSASLP